MLVVSLSSRTNGAPVLSSIGLEPRVKASGPIVDSTLQLKPIRDARVTSRDTMRIWPRAGAMFADNNIAEPRGNHRLLVSHKATLLGSLYTEYLLEGRRVTYSRQTGLWRA